MKHDLLLLASIELIKHVTCVALEVFTDIVVHHATFDLRDFSHQVKHIVLEVNDYGKLIIITFSLED